MKETNQYSIGDLRQYISPGNFGMILDNSNARYNDAIWRRFAMWGTPSDDREWVQGQKETPIMVRASILGTHSNKPQRNGGGWKVYTGSVPKIGHGYSIDEDDLFTIRKNKNMQGIPTSILMTDLVTDRSAAMIGGVHAELNYLTLQALSTGAIHDVSVDGTSVDYKFPIEDSHYLKLAKAKEWFKKASGGKVVDNETADPISDILNAQNVLTNELNLSVDHWKISKELFRRLIQHKNVVAKCVARANYFDKDNVHLTDKEVATFLHDMGVWMFDVVDYKSRHEVDGVSTADAPAFDEHNLVAFSSQIIPFEMKCTNSVMIDRQKLGQIGSNHNYYLVEDRIAVLSTTEERPFKNIVDCELYAAPVFNNIREIGFLTAWSE
ncbi:major capsid protein [Prevotella amnii]|uniref:Uncharacterized protein n=1 Tax=Prevotella amnii DNF00058 TaxID=1401066 RepID=A0A096D4J0_9BACT|nr:major capsid protein [Prevotella amnii]KGF52439.1 hypothetical protein HMPREF9302_03985 [Prevotella amnii DNF00058]